LQCRVCKRRADQGGELCRYHASAVDSLKRGYTVWKEAYPGISWRDYLNRVKTLEDTGGWIKDVLSLEETRES
jgi:hypothetical protein